MLARILPRRIYPRFASSRVRYIATTRTGKKSTVDPDEVAKFAKQAEKWWHPDASAAPLHRMNPTRVSFIRSAIEKNVTMEPSKDHTGKPLSGIDVVDVGCGGKQLRFHLLAEYPCIHE